MEITIPYNFDPSVRPYQLDILSDKRRNKVLVIHRKAGKTALAINKLVHEAHAPGNEGKVFYYICPHKNQAKEIVWSAPDMLNYYVPEQIIAKRNEVDLSIFFKNKSQLYIKGADDPDRLRGPNPYGIVCDEYDQMKPTVYSEIFVPILAANGGWAWLMGTPKGKRGLHEKIQHAKNYPKDWQWVILKASESGIISQEGLEMAQREMKPPQFYNQEYECEFLEGTGIVFRRIRENVYGRLQEPVQGHLYKIGVDLARHQDWTVVTVVDRSNHHLVYFDRFNQIDWQLQKARIEAIARRYNNAMITIDSTGVGDPIAEDLRRCGLIVNDFQFTNTSKKNLIENLAIMIEENQLSYPDIPELIQELEDFTYEILPSGAIRYTAPEGMHDDIVCSFALAVWQIGPKMNPTQETKNYGFNFNLRGQGYKKLIFKH